MPFPASVHAAILKRFADLVKDGDMLRETMAKADRQAEAESGMMSRPRQWPVCATEFQSFRTRVLSLFQYVGVDEIHLGPITGAVNHAESLDHVLGVLRGVADDYENGFLDRLLHRVEADVAADYLGQAESLLGEGGTGKHDHIPAAVLLGATLEKALRTLCSRQVPVVPPIDTKGNRKMMNGLIDDLRKAGAFNELKAKQLRSWAAIRNAAAHGDFDAFARGDVERMQDGVTSFLADHL